MSTPVHTPTMTLTGGYANRRARAAPRSTGRRATRRETAILRRLAPALFDWAGHRPVRSTLDGYELELAGVVDEQSRQLRWHARLRAIRPTSPPTTRSSAGSPSAALDR